MWPWATVVNESVTLAERWNGSAWTLQPTPASVSLGESQTSSLAGVSCTSRNACFAVGATGWSDEGGGGGTSALLERWDGHAWSIAQRQGTLVDDALNGVSCASARFCVAVGVLTDDATEVTVPLVERWTGSGWARGTAPAPHGASLSVLDSVSCWSPTSCTAVGVFGIGNGCTRGLGRCIERPLVERFNGRRWSIQPVGKSVVAATSSLASVSCVSERVCTALGDRRGQPLAVRWDHTGWSVVRLPVPAAAAAVVLGTVSCASASSCATAGYYEIGAGCRPSGRGPCTSRPLIERWNGRRWSVQRIPEPVGATDARLTAVFCRTPHGCVAAGFFSSISGGEPFGAFAERGTGTGWQVQRLVEPIYPAPGQLGQVSCATATSCTAVGMVGGPFDSTLMEHWDGRSWRALSTPAGSDLHAVSCPAPATCIAIGAGAAVLHGSTWTTLPSPATPLGDVSCISPTTCVAVGNAGTRAVAELWNDGRWTVTPTPNPTGAGYATLSGVSCASTTACIAVGYASYSSSPFSVPLVERWDGSTWTHPDHAKPTHRRPP